MLLLVVPQGVAFRVHRAPIATPASAR